MRFDGGMLRFDTLVDHHQVRVRATPYAYRLPGRAAPPSHRCARHPSRRSARQRSWRFSHGIFCTAGKPDGVKDDGVDDCGGVFVQPAAPGPATRRRRFCEMSTAIGCTGSAVRGAIGVGGKAGVRRQSGCDNRRSSRNGVSVSTCVARRRARDGLACHPAPCFTRQPFEARRDQNQPLEALVRGLRIAEQRARYGTSPSTGTFDVVFSLRSY